MCGGGVDRQFSILENFLGDYLSLLEMSSAQLSDMLEVQLLMCLLVEREQKDKYSRTIWGLKSQVIHVNKSIHEGGAAIWLLREKRDALKTLTNETTIEAFS